MIILNFIPGCKSKDTQDMTVSEVQKIIHNPASAHASTSEYLTEISGGPFVFDGGEVKEGTVISHTFYFKNSGKVDLEKVKVNSTCGCTVAEISNQKVRPGQLDSLTVSFDTKGFPGLQERTITLVCNTIPKENKFTIKSNVIHEQ